MASVQVGNACYASAVDSGAAACAAFVPVSSISSGQVQTVTCSSADANTGALNLVVTTTTISTGVTVTNNIQQLQSFPACNQADYVVAAEVVGSGVFAIFALIYGAKKILSILYWSRGSE